MLIPYTPTSFKIFSSYKIISWNDWLLVQNLILLFALQFSWLQPMAVVYRRLYLVPRYSRLCDCIIYACLAFIITFFLILVNPYKIKKGAHIERLFLLAKTGVYILFFTYSQMCSSISCVCSSLPVSSAISKNFLST